MSEQMEQRLHDIMNEFIDSGRLTPEQIQVSLFSVIRLGLALGSKGDAFTK